MAEESTKLIIVGCCLTEGILSIVSNALLLLVFFINPLKNVWQCSSILIFNVALSDFFFGTAFVFWSTAHWHMYWQLDWLGHITFYALWVFTLTSTFTLLALCLERYLVLVHPWDAPRMITKRKTMVACASAWIVSLVTCSASFVGENSALLILIVSSLIELSVLIKVPLYLHSWRQLSRNSSNPLHHGEHRELTIVVFLLVLLLVFTVLPLVICYQVQIVLVLSNLSPTTRERLNWLLFYLLPLYGLNFFLNPIVYAWRLKKYRRSLVGIFLKSGKRARPMAANKSKLFSPVKTKTMEMDKTWV